MQRALTEVAEAKADIEKESEYKKLEWISEKPSTQALLMANKRENRFRKGKDFHGFVLEQKSDTDNDFLQFLELLRKNIHHIPPGTRIELAINTGYTHALYDKDQYKKGNRNKVNHWAAIDLYIGKNGEVNSFVLDAANSVGYKKIHHELMKAFPNGHHYMFEADEVEIQDDKEKTGKRKIVRVIQTAGAGCRVFTPEHIKQLSQINPIVFYDELSRIAKNGFFSVADLTEPDLGVTKVFRSTQSLSTFQSLPDIVRSTPIKKTGQTLEQAFSAKTEKVKVDKTEKMINLTILKKNTHYIAKKKRYYAGLNESTKVSIMLHRKGFIFLKNPILFNLSRQLSVTNSECFKKFITHLTSKLQEQIANKGQNETGVDEILKTIKKMQAFSGTNQAAENNEFLLEMANLFNYLEEHNAQPMKESIVSVLTAALPILSSHTKPILTDDKTPKETKIATSEKEPEHVALYKKACQHLNNNQYKEGVENLQLAIQEITNFIRTKSNSSNDDYQAISLWTFYKIHLANTYKKMAVNYFNDGKVDEGKMYYKMALKEFESLHAHPEFLAIEYHEYAFILYSAGRLDDAITYSEKAVTQLATYSNSIPRPLEGLNKALVENHQKLLADWQLEKALLYQQNAFEKVNNNQYPKAIVYYEKAISIYEKLPNEYQKAEILNALKECLASAFYNYSLFLIGQNKLDTAELYHKKSFQLVDDKISGRTESKGNAILAQRQRLFSDLIPPQPHPLPSQTNPQKKDKA